eukprot:scaffold163840_cov59-Attheya_sp.AAC.2
MVEKNNQHPIDHERGNHNRDADSRDRASISGNYADEETTRVTTRVREGIQEQRRSMDLASKLFRRPSARQAGVGAFHMTPREEEREEDEDPVFQDHSVEAEVDERLARICVSFMGIAALITIVLTIMVFTLGDESTDASSDTDSNLIPTASPSLTIMLHSCSPSNGQIVRSTRYVQLKAVLQKELAQHDPTVFEEPCSPYDLALSWLADEDEMQLIPQAGIAVHQRFGLALLSFTTKMHLMDLLPQLSIDLDYQWLSDQRECEWFGVTCANQESHFDIITGISVRDPDFGTVKAIEIRDLVLTGHIPNELVHLNLAKNRFSGRIDQEEWTTQNLEILALEENKFVGKIPQSITSLKNLGTIPNLIRSSNLEELGLSKNKLGGYLPPALFFLSNLGLGDVAENNMTGTITSALGNLTQLEILDLSFNFFNGPLPSEIGNMISLKQLWLDNNNISDTVPTEFGRLVNLGTFSLDTNFIEGEIPQEVCKLRDEVLLYFTTDCDSKDVKCQTPDCCSRCF